MLEFQKDIAEIIDENVKFQMIQEDSSDQDSERLTALKSLKRAINLEIKKNLEKQMMRLSGEVDASPKPSEEDLLKLLAQEEEAASQIIQSDVEIEALNAETAAKNAILQRDVEIEVLDAETAARNAILQRDVEVEALNAKTAAKNDLLASKKGPEEEEKQASLKIINKNRIEYPHIFSRPLPCHWYDSDFIKKAEIFENLRNLDHDKVKEKLIKLMKWGLLDQAEFFQFFHTAS